MWPVDYEAVGDGGVGGFDGDRRGSSRWIHYETWTVPRRCASRGGRQKWSALQEEAPNLRAVKEERPKMEQRLRDHKVEMEQSR